jgi:hypothetical protein
MNCILIERASGINRDDLIGLAPDHHLVVRSGRKAEIRRGDLHLPVALLDQPGDLTRPVLPHPGLDRIEQFSVGCGTVKE